MATVYPTLVSMKESVMLRRSGSPIESQLGIEQLLAPIVQRQHFVFDSLAKKYLLQLGEDCWFFVQSVASAAISKELA